MSSIGQRPQPAADITPRVVDGRVDVGPHATLRDRGMPLLLLATVTHEAHPERLILPGQLYVSLGQRMLVEAARRDQYTGRGGPRLVVVRVPAVVDWLDVTDLVRR